MKLKFKLNETVFARNSGKKGVVEVIRITNAGVEYGVRNDGTKTKPFCYASDKLESLAENARRVKAEASAAAAAAKAKAKAKADADRAKAEKAKAKAKPQAKSKAPAQSKHKH